MGDEAAAEGGRLDGDGRMDGRGGALKLDNGYLIPSEMLNSGNTLKEQQQRHRLCLDDGGGCWQGWIDGEPEPSPFVP